MTSSKSTLWSVVVQLLSRVWLFAAPWTAACQASLPFTILWSLLKLMSIESVMPSNHLILYCPRLFLASIFPSSRVFSSESALHIRWPKYWSFSFKDALTPPLNSPKPHPTVKLKSQFQIPPCTSGPRIPAAQTRLLRWAAPLGLSLTIEGRLPVLPTTSMLPMPWLGFSPGAQKVFSMAI